MAKEEFESAKKRFMNGDEAFESGDLSAACQFYIIEKNADGLLSVANALIKKGREEEANKILQEAYRLEALKKNGVDK